MTTRHASPARRWALAAALAAAGLYAPTLGHGFVLDDHVVVVQNRLIRSLDRVPELAAATEWAGGGIAVAEYRPLTDVTYALNHAADGLSPWGWHAVNVVVHALASVLLLAVGLRLGLGPAAAGAAALLFAVHPIHVEAVANVVGRKDLLATAFALATVVLHGRALRRGGAALAWPALAYAASMLSKESGVVTIGLVLLHDLAAPPPAGGTVPRARRAALYASYVLALAAYAGLYRTVSAGLGLPPTLDDNVAAHASTAERLMTAVAVVGKGLALQLLPIGQSPDWSYQAIPLVTTPVDPRFLATCAALLTWLGLGIALRRRAPIVLVGLAWYLGTLFPTSNVPFAIGTIFGERLLYLPSAGLALAAGAGFAALAARVPPAPLRAGALAVAICLSLATLSYARVWRDDLSLFRAAVERAPRSARAHVRLSAVLLERGDASAALAEAERAAALNPWNPGAQLARARALRGVGRVDEEPQARRASLASVAGAPGAPFRRAFEDGPADADVLHRLGQLARGLGRLEEAAELWRLATVASPRHGAALGDLAGYHLLHGELERAIALGLRAVAADASSPSAWYNLALAHRARGERERSRAAFRRFVEIAGPRYEAEAEAVRVALRGEGE